MREQIQEKGKRRLLAAMLWRGLPGELVDLRPYDTMRSAWLSTFPKHRGRAFSAGDASAKMRGVGNDLEYMELGGEG